MPPPAIVVSNLRDHELVPHALVVFDGFVSDFHALTLAPHDWFLDARLDAARGAFWPVNSTGRFKALVLLPAPGKYTLTLRLGHVMREFPIEYVPPVSRFVVRFYYQRSMDAHPHEGFDAPPGVDNSDQAALQKIRFNALLLQTAAAEMFVHAGLPRTTFTMEFAGDGLPHVRLLRSSFSNATARTIHEQELIQLVEKDIVANGYDTHDEWAFKHAVILGCSKYNPVTKHSDGHSALGGGKVGIFGSCGLHTWPRHLGEVSACCLNNLRIDTRLLMDDSGNRGSFGANFSTGIGAFIHELGHTFGLGHATSGIMSRGFDDMTRLFCAFEPDHNRHDPGFFQDFHDGRLLLNHQALKEVASPEGAHWNVGSALQLIHCPWISGRPKASTCGPLVCWNNRVRGPVGQNLTHGTKRSFGMPAPRGPLGAVLLATTHYLDDLQTYTRDEFACVHEHELQRFSHRLVLDPHEFITSVEIRAGAWIDGLRIHTNVRSTPWYGGLGGELHVLRPDDSSQINGFFGARGDDFVGSLGVHCCPIMEATSNLQSTNLSAMAVRAGPIGYADQDGPQRPFDQLLEEDLGAVVVKGGAYVSSIQGFSRREWMAMGQPMSNMVEGESWFVLEHGEFITHADVRAMCWVDGLRFHTNTRASPWFGGSGGDLQTLQPPPGYKILSFFGSVGDNFVGALGAHCVPITATTLAPSPLHHVDARSLASSENAATTPFALLSLPLPCGSTMPPHPGVARGVLVAVQDGLVMYVSSFDSTDSKSRLTQELQAFVYAGAQLHCFTLQPNEFLVQIDASVHPQYRTIEGLCVHTTSRCSTWFGAYTDSNLHFLESPTGSVIRSISGVAGAAQLQDVVGDFCPRAAAMHEAQHMTYAQDNGNVREDPGAYDLRVQAQASCGIASVYLLKKLEHEELEQHAWVWKSAPSAAAPHMWCLPQRMLEHHLATSAAQAGKTPTQLLFDGYAIGAMDTGGGYSMAASPPLQ